MSHVKYFLIKDGADTDSADTDSADTHRADKDTEMILKPFVKGNKN
jgi:hypothetical protein